MPQSITVAPHREMFSKKMPTHCLCFFYNVPFFVVNLSKPKHPAKTNVQQEHSLISPVKGQPNQFNGCQVGLWWQFAVSYFLGGVEPNLLSVVHSTMFHSISALTANCLCLYKNILVMALFSFFLRNDFLGSIFFHPQQIEMLSFNLQNLQFYGFSDDTIS